MTKSQIEKKIQQAEKELARMNKKGMATEVIAAQEKVIEGLRIQQNSLINEKETMQNFNRNTYLTFSIVNDTTLEVEEKKYKVAFVKNNRPINKKKVDGFINIIANNKYEKAFPILAMSGTHAIENGYDVKDANGDKVTKDHSEEYIVILDGQHRTLAFLMSSLTGSKTVPNTHIKDGIDIGQYLVDINDVGTSWSQKDRFAVAALVTTDELAHEISDRISEGFNPTTASLIYTSKKISEKEVKKLLRGEDWSLPEGAKLDIKRGNKFIQLCKEANIGVKFITKRYFITGFNAYAESTSEEAAFEKLEKIKVLKLTEIQLREIKDGTQFVKLLEEAE